MPVIAPPRKATCSAAFVPCRPGRTIQRILATGSLPAGFKAVNGAKRKGEANLTAKYSGSALERQLRGAFLALTAADIRGDFRHPPDLAGLVVPRAYRMSNTGSFFLTSTRLSRAYLGRPVAAS